jgi:hypothetical protein
MIIPEGLIRVCIVSALEQHILEQLTTRKLRDTHLENVSKVPVLNIRLINIKQRSVGMEIHLSGFLWVSLHALLLVSAVILPSEIESHGDDENNGDSEAS